jgi:quinol monooxygenase YgiN
MSLFSRRYTLRLASLMGTSCLAAIDLGFASKDEAVAQLIDHLSETQSIGIPEMTDPVTDYPPFIKAPADAAPVIVTVELIAQDPERLEAHLNSAPVIPTTRLAAGINYSWTVRDKDNPNRFVLIQQWNSVQQQQGYIAWRVDRGDFERLRSLLIQDPIVNYLSPLDTTALPAQAA